MQAPVPTLIEKFGSATKAAEALGLKGPSAIWNWQDRGQIPADKVLLVEEFTGISRHELRPDIFGAA